MQQPKNWPKTTTFISSNIWENRPEYYTTQPMIPYEPPSSRIPTIDDAHLSLISSVVCIKKITQQTHPAYTESGLFALKSIKEKKTLLLEYRGTVTCPPQTSQSSNYTLHFHKEWTIDAELFGNEARFINDYRGIAERPLVEFDLYRDRKGIIKIGVFSKCPIRKGQEILINYGKGFWKARGLLKQD